MGENHGDTKKRRREPSPPSKKSKKMARRYDARTTIFSPEGRLYQVEYAMEAISHAGAAVGILGKDGVVLACEKKLASKLLEPGKRSEKMYRIDDHIACAVAGITADANILLNFSRLAAQRYLFAYQEPVPVEQLVQQVCDTKQGYTQYGGMYICRLCRVRGWPEDYLGLTSSPPSGLRPFGVSFLWAGWDKHYGFQLYQSDPSGNYGGWKATAIGANNQAATSLLKQDYSDEFSVQEALKLAVKVLSKTMDSTALSPDKLEFSVLRRAAAGHIEF